MTVFCSKLINEKAFRQFFEKTESDYLFKINAAFIRYVIQLNYVFVIIKSFNTINYE